MSDVHETLEHNGFTINIIHDDTPGSPDEWNDEGVFLVGFHRDFTVVTDDIKSPEDVEPYMDDPDYEVFLLEAYIHSGVRLALAGSAQAAGFPDRRWDVSRVGYVLVKLSEVAEGMARKCAEGLVETWNQYLSGDVWGYVITDSDGEEVESVFSCWGFYGLDACIEEAKATCPEASETKERRVRILAKDGTWVEATITVPLSMGDSQVPAYVMASKADSIYRSPAGIDSVILTGASA
jgi:hypothetical protein